MIGASKGGAFARCQQARIPRAAPRRQEIGCSPLCRCVLGEGAFRAYSLYRDRVIRQGGWNRGGGFRVPRGEVRALDMHLGSCAPWQVTGGLSRWPGAPSGTHVAGRGQAAHMPYHGLSPALARQRAPSRALLFWRQAEACAVLARLSGEHSEQTQAPIAPCGSARLRLE